MKQKIGIVFPASIRETRIDVAIDTCKFYHALGIDKIRFINNGGMDDVKMLPFVEVIDDFRLVNQFNIIDRSVRDMQDYDWVICYDSDELLWQRSDITIRDFLLTAPCSLWSYCI